MTVLVTGVTGLVGARLLPRLVEADLNCRALVRKGRDTPFKIEIVEGDILDPQSLSRAMQGVTQIVHLAAVFRTLDADLIWKSNVEGTRNLIAAAQTYAPEARFIMSSTSNVYNADNTHPGREDDVTTPEAAYPASKVAAETELRLSGLNWAILRFPFVYGDNDGHLESMPQYVNSGTWHPARRMSTIHHRDIANAMILALDGVMDRMTVNISDEAPTTIYELMKLVGVQMAHSNAPLENPWQLHIDGSLARSIGFKAAVRSVYQAAQEGLL